MATINQKISKCQQKKETRVALERIIDITASLVGVKIYDGIFKLHFTYHSVKKNQYRTCMKVGEEVNNIDNTACFHQKGNSKKAVVPAALLIFSSTAHQNSVACLQKVLTHSKHFLYDSKPIFFSKLFGQYHQKRKVVTV